MGWRSRWLSIAFVFGGLSIPLAFNACSGSGFQSKPSVLTQTTQLSEQDPPPEELVPDPPKTPEPENPMPPDPGTPIIPTPEEPTTPAPQDPPYGPAIVAIGHWKSSMYSCDGGMTWRGYQSLNNAFRCWNASHGNVDCDHTSSSAMGVTWGRNGFVATYGWGTPGHVEKSEDGSSWQRVQQGGNWAGVAYGNDTYVLNERSTLISSNATTWSRGGDLNFIPWNARRIFFARPSGGVFISVAESGNVQDLMISTDNARSFRRPKQLPAACGNGSLASSSQRIVLLSRALCVSNDGGDSWQTASTRPSGNHIIFDGQEFKIYSSGTVHRSSDGLTWTSSPLMMGGVVASQLNFYKVIYQPDLGRYAGIYQDWDRFYEYTQYYHSLDGVNWIQVNKAAGQVPQAPHPITQIAVGYLKSCAPSP